MARITRNQMHAAFKQASHAAKWQTGPAWDKQPDGTLKAIVGATRLTHNTYSGWGVERICNEGGAVTMLVEGLAASEMLHWLRGVSYGAEDKLALLDALKTLLFNARHGNGLEAHYAAQDRASALIAKWEA